MVEDTIIKTMDLPEGRDWVWLGDLNMVVLSSRLDCEGRRRAFVEVQAWWHKRHLSLVIGGAA